MSKLTIDDIRDLVFAADRDQLCERMATLSEDQRTALAADALKLVSDIDSYCSFSTKPEEVPDYLRDIKAKVDNEEYPDWRCPRWTSQLLVVGLCDCEAIKSSHKFKIGWLRTDLKDMQQRMLQVLDARRPKWLADWLKWEWKQEFPVPSWYLERGLIRSGALPANDSPEYFARMSDEMQVIEGNFVNTEDTVPLFPSRRAMLEADPDLFKHDIWRLLQVDSSAFRYPQLGWPDLLIELSAAGHLDRMKLLSESLNSMTLPLSVKTLTGLAKFHEQLGPTVAEREQLTVAYLRLLHVSNSTVVGLAVTACDKLQKDKRLAADPFLQNLPGAFLADKKSPALAGIKLAMKVVQSHPAGVPQAAQALVNALQHSDADVQSSALEGLLKLRNSITAELRTEIEEQLDFLAIAIRPQAKRLLDELAASSKAAPVKSSTEKSKSSATPAKQSLPAKPIKSQNAEPSDSDSPDVAHIDANIRRDSHLEAAIAARSASSPPIVLPIAKHVIPRRDPESRVNPIGDLDELISAVATFVEKVDDVMELERILDGISRLHREKPSDFDKRVDALRKQVIKRSETYSDSTLDVGADIELRTLITSWLDMEPIPNPRRIHWYTMRQWFLRERVYELLERLNRTKRGDAYDLKKKPVPMLALPTHRGGWIDPVVLVERINEHYAPQHVLIDDHDLAQAILRLTPDGRAEALSKLGEPDHYNGGAELRYALGDKVHLTFNLSDAVVQLAAERARVVSLAHQDYQPVVPIAQASLGSNQRILLEGALVKDPTVPFELMEIGFSFDPKTDHVHDHLARHLWPRRWAAMTNPMDTDASCLSGQTSHLLDGEATWTAATCRLAILAASQDRGEIRILATDALVEACQRLLVVPEVLGHALAANYLLVKLNRVSKVLSDVAKVSNLHHWLVLRSLEACVIELPELPSDSHLLLSQMVESAIAIGAALQPKACDKLKSIEGKSKSGKLAKQLLGLSEEAEHIAAINTAIVDATFQRACRWQRIASGK
jgi:hypothetical protein